MLKDEVIRLQVVEKISRSSIYSVLKKVKLKPWQKRMWCIGKIDEEYVASMEDVLSLYEEPIDPARPRLCFDERPCLLVGNVVKPLPIRPGQSERLDYEYKRLWSLLVILLAYNMDTGQRHVAKQHQDQGGLCPVHGQRHINALCRCGHRQAGARQPGSAHKGQFLQNFSTVAEARVLAGKLEFHFTPKHASWLNMAEIEFWLSPRQCLNRRFESLEQIEKEVLAWEKTRNQKAIKIHWSFTAKEAREKLSRHYPVIP